MNILILGSGGREHALAWAVQQNPKCDRLWMAPGNPGMAALGECVAMDIEDAAAILTFVEQKQIDFVIIGPEAPLALGVSDALRAADILTFGPSKAAAALESSKNFTKQICDAAKAPTAAYGHFSDAQSAKTYIAAQGAPIVIKADGLAAGKGVIIAEDIQTAYSAVDDMFAGEFGSAGAEVVIEEFMEGEEASFFVLCDGETVLPMGSAQDHKRVGDGDSGPNTGGMGAYSPAPVLTQEIAEKALHEIIRPTMDEMRRRGIPYQGVLYAGLMIKDGQPRLVEYNVRFGDPECQVLMMRFEGDLAKLLKACATGDLATADPVRFSDDTALTVVMAAEGYPGTPKKGGSIALGDAEVDGAKVFHAGTALDDSRALVASGGRVLNVTARGSSVTEAQSAAYKAVDAITFPDGFCRRDIGWREVEREGGRV